ncbi:MAG: class I SAM-dependent methyltransferase [Thermoanaerobaculia bacterium]
MDRAYATTYRELFERHWWWRAREDVVLQALRDLRPHRADRKILDIGCGDGLFFPRLAEFGEVQGVEADAALVAERGPYRNRIQVGPFDETFQPDQPFDLILMLDVLEHLPDPRSSLRHAATLAAKNAFMVVTVPAFRWLWTEHDRWNQHRTRYTKRGLRLEAEASGWKVERAFYFFHWLVLAKLVARAREAASSSRAQPEVVPSSGVNKAALGLSRLERRLLGPLRLPVGSSLLAVLSLTAKN